MDAVHWFLDERGWQFTDGYKDSLYDTKFIKELYYKANPDYVGRFTVPVLWDKKTETIGNMLFFMTMLLSNSFFLGLLGS